jgi:hypothetical protein
MKKLILILLLSLFSCKTVEETIKDYSYTDKWYFFEKEKYQVYKTKRGKEYIFILNKQKTKLKRKYI